MTRMIESRLAVAVALATLVAAGACSKKDNAVDTQTAAGAVVDTMNHTVAVVDVAIGRHVDANKRVSRRDERTSRRRTPSSPRCIPPAIER